MFGLIDDSVLVAASVKVAGWECSGEFFLKSVLCGAIMYLAVAIYRKGSPIGILLGVPLFIFCGFQHSIANAITMGVALSFSWSIIVCVAGNLVGALVAWLICAPKLISTTKAEEQE